MGNCCGSNSNNYSNNQNAPVAHFRSGDKKIFCGFSGGGLRSLASAAVFSHALQSSTFTANNSQKTWWGEINHFLGVSGGAWFLIALAYGKNQDSAPLIPTASPSFTIDDLLALLTTIRVITALTPEEQKQIVIGFFNVIDGSSSEEASNQKLHEAIVNNPFSSGKAFSNFLDQLVNKLEVKIAEYLVQDSSPGHSLVKLLNRFGTGMIAAGDDNAIEKWRSIIIPRLGLAAAANELLAPPLQSPIAEGAEPTQVKISVSAIASALSADQDAYDWIRFQLAPGTRSVELNRSFVKASARRSEDLALSDPKLDVGLLAATVASSFAFDLRSLFRPQDQTDATALATAPVIPGTTQFVEFKPKRGGGAPYKLQLRDAGIQNNLPFTNARNCDIFVVLDSSANGDNGGNERRADAGQRGHLLALATKLKHMPAYKEVATSGPEEVPGSWKIFQRFLESCKEEEAPEFVVYFLGLNDNATMELADEAARDARVESLKNMHARLLDEKVGIKGAMKKLFPYFNEL